jgi:hypothetical protein
LYWSLCCLSCFFLNGHCVVCPSIIFVLAIGLSAFLRFPDADYLIGIVNLLLYFLLIIIVYFDKLQV